MCEAEGECHYTGSPFEQPLFPRQLIRSACEIVENLQSQRKVDREARLERAIREALKILGSTQPRPYTALSRIDGILREGLR